jgi:hypothetical protein
MPILITDCPRCGSSKITFDVVYANIIDKQYSWQNWYEAFCTCRHCNRATIFVLSDSQNADFSKFPEGGIMKVHESLNHYVVIERYVSVKDESTIEPPKYIPPDIKNIFNEGATCLVVDCFNASGTMFRLCVDLATCSLLPKEEAEGLNAKVRRDLGLRIPWLIDHEYLPESLRELSTCIKEDGNDGAHAGTLKKPDAEDLMDFTVTLLERLYTEPERIRLAQIRRDNRRKKE